MSKNDSFWRENRWKMKNTLLRMINNLRRKMTLSYKERYFAEIAKANTFFLIVQGAVGDVY